MAVRSMLVLELGQNRKLVQEAPEKNKHLSINSIEKQEYIRH